MIKQTSNDFKALFLLEFTRELIEHSTSKEVFKLGEILKEETKERKRQKQRFKKALKIREQLKDVISPLKMPLLKPLSQSPKPKPVLKVPKIKLPQHLQYLKPIPTSNVEIELGKLDPLIKDPTLTDIECNGPNENIVVKGTIGTKKANIVLTKEEIDDVIKKFSEAAKIPVHEGLFKVVVGKMIFSAVVSEITGSRFIIKKMMYNPIFK